MKLLLLIPLLIFEGNIHTTELDDNYLSYSADYTSGNLSKIIENINIDEHKYYQEVVLDQDNVYRLKTFKKKFFTTPKMLENLINLEANLTIQHMKNSEIKEKT